MGKKRKFNRFIRWIKSDLPDDSKTVLLLGVTKIPSPTAPRARPHTLHLDHHLEAKSQTLDSQPRHKPRLFRSHSGDSLNELLTCHLTAVSNKSNSYNSKNTPKKVSFDTKNCNSNINSAFKNGNVNKKRLGFCSELPYEYYHQNSNSGEQKLTNDVRHSETVMDKSVDSIGSCSLDVDASSTDFSDSSVGSSDCTLRSLGIPTPTTQPSNPLSFRIESSTLNESEPKKPSYLNLACTVNGYSNITNYDSKLRENFRTPKSREVSPIRPQEYHASVTQDPNNKYLTPNYIKPLLSSPNMGDNKSQTILHSTSSNSYSFSSSSTTMSSKKFISNMIFNSENDTVDRASFSQNKISSFAQSKISHTSYVNGRQKSNISETIAHESFVNGQNSQKSFIQQRVERLYGPGALAQGFFISKRSKNRLSESENGEISNCKINCDAEHKTEEIKNKFNDINLKQSSSSPSLPVLRHLRPEFRAQLPILSSKKVNQIQKSTTVPSSLTNVNATNGTDIKIDKSNKENIIIHPDITSNGTSGIKKEATLIKDGHYFLKILKYETDRLIDLAKKAEADIEAQKNVLTDDVLGFLRSVSGKARLLVTQKMQQFEGLCHKNINQVDGEPFPTTPEDLLGFWDMVMLQVTQVDDLFAELDRIRANNWIIEETPKPEITDSSAKPKKLIVKKPISANAEAQRKQREAARKKLLEDKRKAMRAKQSQVDQIEIFVPESS